MDNLELIETKFESKDVKHSDNNLIWKIIYLGILTFITITSTAILHANEQEFILDRFTNIDSFKLSLFDTIVYIAFFIMGIFIGILSDRFSKRKTFILIGSIGAGLLFIFMTLTLNYALLLFLRFLQGCFSIMIWQILMTIILDLSTAENRGKNMGIYGAFLAFGMGLGPMLGGFIAEISVFAPYYFASGLMALVLILSLFLKEPKELQERSTIKESLLILKEKPRLIIPSLFNFIDRLHMGIIIFVLPLIIGLSPIEGGLGLDTKYRGIAFGLFALPFIILQYPFGRLSDKIGRYIPLIIGSLGYGITLSLFGYFGTSAFGFLIIFLIILGVLSGITAPPSMALIGDTIDDPKQHGMGMGVYTLFGNIGISIGPTIGGLLMNKGFGLTFLIAGQIELFALLVIILLLLFAFKVKILPTKNKNS